MINEHFLIEATERYLKGEMNAEERSRFEQDRKVNPELDQYVVGHDLFQKNLDHYSRVRRFKQQLHETHHHLIESGELQPLNLGKVVKMQLFWKKYKKTISIAASIAGIIAISINAITYIISPNGNAKKSTGIGEHSKCN